ncbi:hypothetical protein ACEPAH_4124 [Sanghuangporus vaninii]
MSISLNEASLLAIVVESMLFGILTALFVTAVYTMIFKGNDTRTLNKPALAVSVLMYCIAFVHVSINARRAVFAFIKLSDNSESVEEYFLDSSNAVYLAKINMYLLQTLLGDTFIIYRLFIVWGRDFRLLIPAGVLLTASTVCAVFGNIAAARVSPSTLIFIPQLKRWIVSIFSLTLFTNASCTALIAFRIWWTGRQLRSASWRNSLSPVIAIVVESAAVYSVSLISLMAAYLSGSWGHYIVLDMMPQIIAITFLMIIVRISLGISSSKNSPPLRSRNEAAGSHVHRHQVSLQPLVVHLARSTTVKNDLGETVGLPSGDGDSMSAGKASFAQNR